MIDFDFIKKVSVFNGLDNDQLGKILAGCHEKEFKKGEKLFGDLLCAFVTHFFDSLDLPWLYVFGNHDPDTYTGIPLHTELHP